MRYLAVGDIHGSFKALTTLEAFVPFQPDDVIVTLGDYVNRGPDSCAVLDWLIARNKKGNLVPLRGNHEILMLRARDGEMDFKRWLEYGGDKALASYSPFGDSGRLVDIPDSHWQFLDEETRVYYEIPTHFFVHANVHPNVPLQDQPDYMLFWEPFNDPPPHQSGKIMVCGHTAQKSCRPRNLGHAVCIDTWAWAKGWLTCLDVASGQYWQANQRGQTRQEWLVKMQGGGKSGGP